MPSPLPTPAPAAPQGFPIPGLSGPNALPLFGLTILAVEDSRYASEALRLLCARSGARLRRAETLAAARAHLRVYRPDVVIVDLGLPDGKGEALIRDLVLARPRTPVVLGSSGAEQGRMRALAAGADGFLDKPIDSLSGFCATLLAHLPDQAARAPAPSGGAITPDRLALHEDLAQAADLLRNASDAPARRYLAGFLHGIARHAQDEGLANAAARALHPGTQGDLACLRQLIEGRLNDPVALRAF